MRYGGDLAVDKLHFPWDGNWDIAEVGFDRKLKNIIFLIAKLDILDKCAASYV